MKRTISITGEATSTMKPDMCVINFGVKKYDLDYSKCVEKLNNEVNEILKKLEKLNINRDTLTTKDFEIRAKNEYDKDLEKYVFVNYLGEHRIDIKVDNDSKVINDILSMLQNEKFTPEVSISFGVKNEELLKDMALNLAIENAKKNADIISKGLDIKLSNILEVNYNFDKDISSKKYDYLQDMMICENSCDFNIMPEETKYEERVSIVWEIEN